MARKRGRPQVDPKKAKSEHLDIRISAEEKQAFKDAADVSGLALSAWIRERLRQVARKELEQTNRPVAFLHLVGGKRY